MATADAATAPSGGASGNALPKAGDGSVRSQGSAGPGSKGSGHEAGPSWLALWRALTTSASTGTAAAAAPMPDPANAIFAKLLPSLKAGLSSYRQPSPQSLSKLRAIWGQPVATATSTADTTAAGRSGQQICAFIESLSALLHLDELQTLDLVVNYFRDVRLDMRQKDIRKSIDVQLQSTRTKEQLRDALVQFYHEERLSLLRSQLFILSNSSNDPDKAASMAPSTPSGTSEFFEQLLASLLSKVQMEQLLRRSLGRSSGDSVPDTPGGGPPMTPRVSKFFKELDQPFGRAGPGKAPAGGSSQSVAMGNFSTPTKGATPSASASRSMSSSTRGGIGAPVPRHLQLQWIMQYLREQTLQLQILHQYFALHLPTQSAISDLCGYVDAEIIPDFHSWSRAGIFRGHEFECFRLCDRIRFHQVLLLMQLMQLQLLPELSQDVQDRLSASPKQGLADSWLLEYLTLLRPLHQAVKRWMKFRLQEPSTSVSSADVQQSAVVAMAGPLLIVYTGFSAWLSRLKNQAEEAGCEDLAEFEILDVELLYQAATGTSRRSQQLHEMLQMTENAALPIDGWKLLQRVMQMDLFKISPEAQQEATDGDAAATRMAVGVDLISLVDLRETLVKLVYQSLDAALAGCPDMISVLLPNFDSMLEVISSAVALLPESASMLVDHLRVPAPRTGIAQFASHTLETFPYATEALPSLMNALSRAVASSAEASNYCGKIYDLLCTMTGFCALSHVDRQELDWNVIAMETAMSQAPSFFSGEDRTYVVALRDTQLAYSTLVLNVPAGAIGVVVAEDVNRNVLIRWNVMYSGWFFFFHQLKALGTELSTPEDPATSLLPGVQHYEHFGCKLVQLVEILCQDADLRDELRDHLNDILLALGRPAGKRPVTDAVISIFQHCTALYPCPLDLGAACLSFLTARIADEGQPVWLGMIESGALLGREGAGVLGHVQFHSERREGSYVMTAAFATLVEMLLVGDLIADSDSAVSSIWQPVLPWTRFLMRHVVAEFSSWRYKHAEPVLSVLRSVLRIVNLALTGSESLNPSGLRSALRRQVMSDIDNDATLAPALMQIVAQGRSTLQAPSNQRTERELLLWTEVLELTLQALHVVLRRRPQQAEASVLDNLLLVTAPDSHVYGVGGLHLHETYGETTSRTAGEGETSDNAILTVASLIEHAQSPLIPLFAIRLLTQICRISARLGQQSVSVALGSHASALRDILLRRLEGEASTSLLVAILRLVKETAFSQPGLCQLLTDICRKKASDKSPAKGAAAVTTRPPPILKGGKAELQFEFGESSCLPEVLNILGDGKWIKENPELIVAAMDLIRALWTGPPATLLRRSPNFWPSVLRPLLDKDVVRLMEDERLPEKRANLLRAKAFALEMLTVETFSGNLQSDAALEEVVAKLEDVPSLDVDDSLISRDVAQANVALASTWCRFVCLCCGLVDEGSATPTAKTGSAPAPCLKISIKTFVKLLLNVAETMAAQVEDMDEALAASGDGAAQLSETLPPLSPNRTLADATSYLPRYGAYQEHYRISRELTGLFSLLLLRHMGSQASAVRKAVFDVDAKKLLSCCSQSLARLSYRMGETTALRGDMYALLLALVPWLLQPLETLEEDMQTTLENVMLLVWEAVVRDCERTLLVTIDEQSTTSAGSGRSSSGGKAGDSVRPHEAGLLVVAMCVQRCCRSKAQIQPLYMHGHLEAMLSFLSTCIQEKRELRFVTSALELCVTLAGTESGAEALLFGQRPDFIGGAIYHLRDCATVLWREHARTGRSMNAYTDKGTITVNPWHSVWCTTLRLIATLVHTLGARCGCLHAALNFALSTMDQLRATLAGIRDAGTITAEFLGQLEATTQFLAALSAHADEWKRHMPVLFQYNELLLDLAVQVQRLTHYLSGAKHLATVCHAVTAAEKQLQSTRGADLFSATPSLALDEEFEGGSLLTERYHRTMSECLRNSLFALCRLTVPRNKRDMTQVAAQIAVFSPDHHVNLDDRPSLGTLLACLDLCRRAVRRTAKTAASDSPMMSRTPSSAKDAPPLSHSRQGSSSAAPDESVQSGLEEILLILTSQTLWYLTHRPHEISRKDLQSQLKSFIKWMKSFVGGTAATTPALASPPPYPKAPVRQINLLRPTVPSAVAQDWPLYALALYLLEAL